MSITGATVQAVRHIERLTQAELAKRIGVHTNTVVAWEKSPAVPVRGEMLLRKHFTSAVAEAEASMPTAPMEPTLSQASTLELLAELTKRAARETGGALRDAAQLAVDPPGFAARAAREEAERREVRE